MHEDYPAQIPQWVRERFPSDQRSAVDYFRASIDEGMLRQVAEADYAQDFEKHFGALRPIWEGDEITELDCWFPVEVLELTRWTEVAIFDKREHQIRAFSCSVLLVTPNVEPSKETLIQLVDSAFQLGREAQEATGRFLTWRLNTLDHEEERPFFALAIAAIAQSLEPDLPVSSEQDLADWVQEEERVARECLAEYGSWSHTSRWLFGLSFGDMLNEKWEALIATMQKASGNKPLGRMLAEQNKA